MSGDILLMAGQRESY